MLIVEILLSRLTPSKPPVNFSCAENASTAEREMNASLSTPSYASNTSNMETSVVGAKKAKNALMHIQRSVPVTNQAPAPAINAAYITLEESNSDHPRNASPLVLIPLQITKEFLISPPITIIGSNIFSTKVRQKCNHWRHVQYAIDPKTTIARLHAQLNHGIF